MRKIKFLVVLGLFLYVSLGASAYDFSAKNADGVTIYYNITSSTDLTCGVTYKGSSSYYASYSGIVNIPASVTYNSKTYSVTSIGDEAFEFCSGLTSIEIPNSVTSIGDEAFLLCFGLTSIEIPNSVTSIGDNAFYQCTSLTSVTIGNSVTSIGNWAFSYCSGLTSIVVESGNTKYDSRNNCNAIIETATNTLITGCMNSIIPNSVTSIGNDAFYQCTSLTSITIPNSVTSIENDAFGGCSGLTSIVVESGNTKYDSRNNCNAIIETATNTLITGCMNSIIPNSVTSIGNDAFYQCTSLTSITIPNSVASIGNEAFCLCSGLKSATIGNSVTSIGDYAFYGCSGLTSIEIPNSVVSIGSSAFYYCSGLTSVTIPNSVTSIGNNAFDWCSVLTSVTNFATTPQVISDGTFFTYGTLHVLKGYKDVYAAADVWKNFTIVDDVDPALGIEEIGLTPAFSTREEVTYNLQGVKVNDVKQGNIYVHNGRKFIAK